MRIEIEVYVELYDDAQPIRSRLLFIMRRIDFTRVFFSFFYSSLLLLPI